MSVLKPSSPRAQSAQGNVFDLGDLRRDAEAVLRNARAEAVRILDEARKGGDAARATGRLEGIEQGRAEGLARGLEEGRTTGANDGRTAATALHCESLAAIEESFSTAFLHWIALRDEHMREAERELAGVAVAIAERIVGEKIAHDPRIVTREVAAAVALFSRATRVSIEIAPEDEAIVSESMSVLRAQLPAGADVELIAREGIARGGCVIRSSEGTVDARIEMQFRRMRDGITGVMLVDDEAAQTDDSRNPRADSSEDPS